jgi:hypothetical protein
VDNSLLLEAIAEAFTGGALKRSLRALGYQYPAEITHMYLSAEPPEYIREAVLAVTAELEQSFGPAESALRQQGMVGIPFTAY